MLEAQVRARELRAIHGSKHFCWLTGRQGMCFAGERLFGFFLRLISSGWERTRVVANSWCPLSQSFCKFSIWCFFDRREKSFSGTEQLSSLRSAQSLSSLTHVATFKMTSFILSTAFILMGRSSWCLLPLTFENCSMRSGCPGSWRDIHWILVVWLLLFWYQLN